MGKNIDFIIRGIIIYIIIGFSFCAANEVALKFSYWGNIIIFVSFMCLLDRLITYDKQKNIKIFKHINIAYMFLFITSVTILAYDLFHN